MEASAPAAPRNGGRWGLDVLRSHMYEAPPGPLEGLGMPDSQQFHRKGHSWRDTFLMWKSAMLDTRRAQHEATCSRAQHRLDWRPALLLKSAMHMKTLHMAASAPAAPRRGGCWGLHVLCFQIYDRLLPGPTALPDPLLQMAPGGLPAVVDPPGLRNRSCNSHNFRIRAPFPPTRNHVRVVDWREPCLLELGICLGTAPLGFQIR
jgi:hypothetical protein